MAILAIIVFTILAAIGALHVAWGFGLRWPARNERDLVGLVVGKTNLKKMPPPMQCFVAGTAIFVAGCIALFAANVVRLPLPESFVTFIAIVALSVFLGRGVAGFLPAWRKRFSQQPFADFDRLFYSPLCLAIATAFGFLVLSRV